MYNVVALLGLYDPDMDAYSNAQVHGLSGQGGVAGVTFVGALLEQFGANWLQGDLSLTLPISASILYKINAKGDSVGATGIDNTPTEVGIVVSGGEVTVLSPWQGSLATDISDSGLVCCCSNEKPGSFVYSTATKDLVEWIPPLPGQESATATAINNAGEVAGLSGEAGFYFYAGTVKSLGPFAFLADLNDEGIVCGSVAKPIPAYYAGAICDARQPEPAVQVLPLPPGAIGSHAQGINSQGDVVGNSWTAQTYDLMQQSAYICHNGVSTDLNTLISAPGWHLTYANDINDIGQIVGVGTLNGVPTSFLLNPLSLAGLGQLTLPQLVGTILGGVAVDGGGWAIIGGRPIPIDPWGAWVQIQPEKQDALVALAMDEIATYLVDATARETVRKALMGVVTRRLEAMDVSRGRRGPPAATGVRGTAKMPQITQGLLAESLARLRR